MSATRKSASSQYHCDVLVEFKDQPLTREGNFDVFQQEVCSACEPASYLGLWPLASLANVLHRPVVYPVYGGHNVRPLYQRIFWPKDALTHSPIHIMWTNTRGTSIPSRQWSPNHFVLLLPIATPHLLNLSTTRVSIWGLSPTPRWRNFWVH